MENVVDEVSNTTEDITMDLSDDNTADITISIRTRPTINRKDITRRMGTVIITADHLKNSRIRT